MLSPYQAADALEAGERRGRLLWERRLLLAFGDGVAVAITFLIALNLRSAEIRHEFFAVPGWPMLVVLVTWYVCAELVDGYRLVNTVNPRAAFTTAASALMLSFVALVVFSSSCPIGSRGRLCCSGYPWRRHWY